MRRSGFKAFAEHDLGSYLSERLARISEIVKNESDDYVLNVSEVEYRTHLVEQFTIDPPVLHVDQVSMDEVERMVRAEDFPFTFNVYAGKSYPRPAYAIHIPMSGETHLVSYQPSTRLMWTYPISLSGNILSFEVMLFTEEPGAIRREIDSITGNLLTQLGHLCSDVNAYNMSLATEIQRRIEVRKQQILKQRDVVSGIGIPLRKAADAPQTFSVPSPAVPKKISPKPHAATRPTDPEPTLAQDDYWDILKVVHDLGISLERHPSTYQDKDEEDLRDYLLLLLQPRFEGSATGETFNKSGKTDILLRYQNENVFIAECKFWNGIQGLLAAISQLLGYLTWRDSKAALVLFVRNKNFGDVLGKLEEGLREHPEFGRLVTRHKEAWIETRFTLPGDPSREITLTVLAFHVP